MKWMYSLLFLAVLSLGCDKEDEPTNNGNTNQEPKEDIVRIRTAFGDIHVYLYKGTPQHRANFLKLAGNGFYDSTTFHRCITNFVIQGGDPNSKDNDPNNDGNGGPGYTIPAEFVDSLKNYRGSVATARLPDQVNPEKESSGSQFYINLKHNANLDGAYTVFGLVLDGMDVADVIVAQPKNANERPLTDIRMDVDIVPMTAAEIKTKFNFDLPK